MRTIRHIIVTYIIAKAAEHCKRTKKERFPAPRYCFSYLSLVSDVRHQGNNSCLLDGLCDFSLMDGTSTCDSSRKDLTSLGNILLQSINVFVIYCLVLISAELAYFLSSHAAASFVIKCHDFLLSFRISLLERDIIILQGCESARYINLSRLFCWSRCRLAEAALLTEPCTLAEALPLHLALALLTAA